ncbi:hypothetical protein LPW11_13685 [Geomonas sp. RF6]|uniref:hypothetical protein n=1 Tax=Geomonas sp. RF6 TaxID=2897342 RepID=UPI001E5795CE|nr:hypothetical protein [Geomonas sp. RF6]UFS68946.1 hypothetical protein LPW11_13685 [Geomonas sp. RF6]
MKKIAAAIVFALCAGCASKGALPPDAVGPPAPAPRTPSRANQAEQLSQAVKALGRGDVANARGLLAAVCEAPPVAGVTDEALFRLALLSVRPGGESTRAHQLLRRLKREYPQSPWTAQAQPLADQLSSGDELRRQNRTYRTQRDALSKENSDLRDTIEQLKRNIDELKHLDLELEKKSR